MNIQGGVLTGAGVIDGDLINSGLVAPGDPLGILSVNGNYSQTSAGLFHIEVGGTAPGSQFDQLDVSGTATFGVTLNVNLTNGFGPTAGQTFRVVAFAAVSGNFATMIGLAPYLTADFESTGLVLNAVATAADLAVVGITLPAAGVVGQSLTVGYTVENLGSASLTGDWVDSIYLSALSTLDASARLLGRVTHTGGLGGLASYNGSLTSVLPGMTDGSYHVFVVTDSQKNTGDADRTNNSVAAPGVLPVNVPALTLGVPVSGTLTDGRDVYYRLIVAPGQDVNLTATFATPAEAQLLVRSSDVPDRSNYDQTVADLNDLHPTLLLPGAAGGVVYVLLHGREGAAGGQPFTLRAQGQRQLWIDQAIWAEFPSDGRLSIILRIAPVATAHGG